MSGFQLIASLASALAWPSVILVAVIWLKHEIAQLIAGFAARIDSSLKNLKILGFEATFDTSLTKIERKLVESEQDPVTSHVSDPSSPGVRPRRWRRRSRNPVGAPKPHRIVAEAWKEVQNAAVGLIETAHSLHPEWFGRLDDGHFDIDVRRSLEDLFEHEVLPKSLLDVFQEMRDLYWDSRADNSLMSEALAERYARAGSRIARGFVEVAGRLRVGDEGLASSG